jgi:membrane protease YdiL (CAAX protease family)
MCVAIGISEEVAMRGYLIPRFEQLLGSTWSAVGLSAAIFASYHIYQGAGPALSIFVTGLILGGVFVLTRRLWPVIVAHAITDLIPM